MRPREPHTGARGSGLRDVAFAVGKHELVLLRVVRPQGGIAPRVRWSLSAGLDAGRTRGDLAWTVRSTLDATDCAEPWPIALERQPRDCAQHPTVVAVPSSRGRSACMG